MNLIFASHNQHKLQEVRASLGARHLVTSLAWLGWTDEIPETEDSLLGNARLKAHAVSKRLGQDCFADDTGLEIEALNGAPGVITARFAGQNATAAQNREKTLSLMNGQTNRLATFRTVIVLILQGREYIFEGKVPGEITNTELGKEGFGYDPIFRPLGFEETYAEMPLETRTRISHRALALAKMRKFLELGVAVPNESFLPETNT